MFAKTALITSLLAVVSASAIPGSTEFTICTGPNFSGTCLSSPIAQLTCNNIPAPFNEHLGSIRAPSDRDCWIFPETKPKCDGIKDFTEIGLCDPEEEGAEGWCKHDIVIVKAGQVKTNLKGKKYGTIRC